jgi:CheY-like chemotaxis protein
VAHKLLLADDSVTIQRVIELTFADEDVQVLTAGDGEQAIARVEADRPDIVLCDIGMPKRSGYDVAAFIKERAEYSHIPVLLLTGAFEPVDEARAREVRCDGVLVKPFEPQHVIARVRELLRGAATRAAGGSVARAVSDVPRPIERLSPQRGAEMPGSTPGAMVPAPHNARAASDEALDDYFDRLDAAFASMSGAPADAPRAVHHPEVLPRGEGPVLESDLDYLDSPAMPPDVPVAPPPPPSPPPPPAPVRQVHVAPPPPQPLSAPAPAESPAPVVQESTIAGVFSALLAAEQGGTGAAPVRLALKPAPPAITDELIQEVTRRVIERLAPGAVRDVVSDVVKEMSERLIREEIARLRKKP